MAIMAGIVHARAADLAGRYRLKDSHRRQPAPRLARHSPPR